MTDAARLDIRDVVLGRAFHDRATRPKGGRAGSAARNLARVLIKNLQRTPQAVVKRVRNGGTSTRKELTTQLEYVWRDQDAQITWQNLGRGLEDEAPRSFANITNRWPEAWRGNPKSGHTDHIVLSFPDGTKQEQAEAIAKDWGERVFGSGDYGDRWRYAAALHTDSDHHHAHFIVNKHGTDDGVFMSIRQGGALNFDEMRIVQVEEAAKHGLELNASTRLSRGLVEPAISNSEYLAAKYNGRTVNVNAVNKLTPSQVEQRREKVDAVASAYDRLATYADTRDPTSNDGKVFTSAADTLREGREIIKTVVQSDVQRADGLLQAIERAEENARKALESIQNARPSEKRVDIEQRFAAASQKIAEWSQEPAIQAFAKAADPARDPYAHSEARALATVARKAEGPEQDAVRREVSRAQGEIAKALTSMGSELAKVGTSPEEFAARFTSAQRSEGQLQSWAAREQGAGGQEHLARAHTVARQAFAEVKLDKELTMRVARTELMQSTGRERLADLPAVQKALHVVAKELGTGDIEKIKTGNTEPLTTAVPSRGLRTAIAAEIQNGALEVKGQGRDSQLSIQAKTMLNAEEKGLQQDTAKVREEPHTHKEPAARIKL